MSRLVEMVSIPKSKVGEERYLRERIRITIINRFGGITQIVNMEKIIEQTGIPRKMLVSALKSKLGCRIEDKPLQTTIFKMETVERLEEILESFIEENVVCPRCGNPEFEIEKGKKKDKWICKACGDSSRCF